MAYYDSGRMVEGIKMLRHALADCERYLGQDDPLTKSVRDNLQAVSE
jgi:hypothetical protein